MTRFALASSAAAVSRRSNIPHMQRLNIPRQRVAIAVVCDPNERQWDDARRRYALDTFTPDYREVLADPEIDLVLVLTSMQEHGEIARAALEAGKHVLVEKPMAMTLPEAAELVQLAQRAWLSRLRAARRPQPDLSGDLAASAAGRHRHGPQRARFLRLAGPSWGYGSIGPAAGRCSTSASTT